MIIIGLTGGTGAGKTTALLELEKLGGYVVDCDAQYHGLLRDSDCLKAELVRHFGDILTDGEIDRKKLGELVFRHDDMLLELNEITHRFIAEEIERQIQAQRAGGRRLFAIDAIALIESGLGSRCSIVIGVIAPKPVRVRRIMEREGIDERYARLRVEAQKPDSFFRQNCDIILENNADNSEEFGRHCRQIFSEIIDNTNNERQRRK